MHLYISDYREKENNTQYKTAIEIKTKADMVRAVKHDHMADKMKDSYRNTDNFLQCDCVMFDIDNTHSEDPDAWRSADDICEALPVNYIMVRSRNYMKEKRKTNKTTGQTTIYEPREKWHIYAPLSTPITTREAHKELMQNILALFPYIDESAIDCARFFYGVEKPHITYETNGINIDDYIKGIDPQELHKEQETAITEYIEKIQEGIYKQDKSTFSTVKSVCTFLGIDNPLQTNKDYQETGSAEGMEWLETADQQKALAWLEEWANKYGVVLGKQYPLNVPAHPKAIAICVTCPWEDEHSMNGAENEAVIIVENSGKFDFICRHSHGSLLNWKKYRAYYEEQGSAEDSGEDYAQNTQAAYITSFKQNINNDVLYKPISTGFNALDKILDGGLKNSLYFIGAISSLGKTTLALQIGDNIAQRGHDVILFSLEMGKDELTAKSISRHTYQLAVDPRHAKTVNGILEGNRYKSYNDTEKQLISDAIDNYSDYAGHIVIKEGMGNIGVKEIREQVKAHIKATGNRPVIIVDYLQILAPYNDRTSDKQNTDKAVLELKRISRDYKIPVLGISSFNRDSYKAGSSGRVSMADFKESGAIEYGADVLIGLEFAAAGRDNYNEQAEKKKDPREIRLVILKNRNYKAWDSVTFKYYPKFNYFSEMEEPTAKYEQPEEEAINSFVPLGTHTGTTRSRERKRIDEAFNIAKREADALGADVTLYALAEIMDVKQSKVKSLLKEYGGYTLEKDGTIIETGNANTGVIITKN